MAPIKYHASAVEQRDMLGGFPDNIKSDMNRVGFPNILPYASSIPFLKAYISSTSHSTYSQQAARTEGHCSVKSKKTHGDSEVMNLRCYTTAAGAASVDGE